MVFDIIDAIAKSRLVDSDLRSGARHRLFLTESGGHPHGAARGARGCETDGFDLGADSSPADGIRLARMETPAGLNEALEPSRA